MSDVNTSTAEAQRPMSLKERIASYQARASGTRLRSPVRKSLDKSMTKESPVKRPSLRSRFFKNPVYASPSGGKSSELSRIARKVCDEGISQLTRTSVKYPESDEKVAAVVYDLKLALESTLKQLRLLETENKQRAIPN